MLYMICPTCGELLGNKELIYVQEMKKICDEFGIDDNMISQGLANENEKIVEQKKKLIQDLCVNMCCRMRMMNYINLVNLVKG
jgi:DNA-directed RNA polymerase subunit N (RpoN/RPB10)